MQHTTASAIQIRSRETRSLLPGAGAGDWFWSGRAVPYLYLCITLPAVLLLCFLVPPMQTMDESRHFVRACQIAQGGWRSEIDAATGRGGVLPVAVADFVRRWMNTDHLRSEDALHTIHPISLTRVTLSTLKHYGAHFYREMIGVLGWAALPLPAWFYLTVGCLAVAVLLIGQSCPASVENALDSWLERVVTGRREDPEHSRVLVTAEDGTILGESDPALTGADFPYALLPGSSRSRWRTYIWYLNKNASIRL